MECLLRKQLQIVTYMRRHPILCNCQPIDLCKQISSTTNFHHVIFQGLQTRYLTTKMDQTATKAMLTRSSTDHFPKARHTYFPLMLDILRSAMQYKRSTLEILGTPSRWPRLEPYPPPMEF